MALSRSGVAHNLQCMARLIRREEAWMMSPPGTPRTEDGK